MKTAAEMEPVIAPVPEPSSPPAAAPSAVEAPLAVDLDGTLVKTDLLLESLAALLKQAPWWLPMLPFWLLRGRAWLKKQIARRVCLDIEVLPYRQELLERLRSEHARGRTMVLATAADGSLARQIADHLKLFDLVFASDGVLNLSGANKRDLLVGEFGERGFDYIGNGTADEAVWSSARDAIRIAPDPSLRAALARRLKVLRPHHWTKNLLVFIPLLAAHRMEWTLAAKLAVAFLAFGLVASSGYLVNDLLDLASDRHHPHKRLRPFAAGDLPLTYALRAIPILFCLGVLAAAWTSPLLLGCVLTYFALTLAYSLEIRKIAVLDVIFLASLYTIRILAGSAAVQIWPSHWLLAFSTFVFFSLALVKRYGELMIMKRVDGKGAKARGYELSDAELLASMGVASGYLAVLVLALYINTVKAQLLYGRYQLIWFLCPLLLYWISHVWLIAHRGKMPDDPVAFALHDRTSWILAALIAGISVLAL